MNKTAVYGALLLAIGLAAGVSLGSRDERGRAEPLDPGLPHAARPTGQNPGVRETASGGGRHASRLEQQLERLAAKLAAETDERRRLQERIEGLASELAALRGGGDGSGHTVPGHTAPGHTAPGHTAPGHTVPGHTVPEHAVEGHSVPALPAAVAGAPGGMQGPTTMERALVAAGIDTAVAADIKRRRDELALSEIYLRDLATREGWLDTPAFAEDMAEIERQRTSTREEIGDEAYDRYLAALDQPNRVAVQEVLLDSPAALAGLQAGDLVLGYGETRIFSPGELVSATHAGVAGEPVRLAIIRDGQRLEIEVARGPLGIRVMPSRGNPDNG